METLAAGIAVTAKNATQMVEEADHQAVAVRTMAEEAREAERAARRALDAAKESVDSSFAKYRRRRDQDRACIGELERETAEVHAVVEHVYSLLVEDTNVEYGDKIEGLETQFHLLVDEAVRTRAE